jgi:hypothetical protein
VTGDDPGSVSRDSTVKFKLVPAAPDDLDAVRATQRAVPLVPVPEDEAVARLSRRLDAPSRDVARTWLTFLRALGLVEATDSGFRRSRVEPTVDQLREAFVSRVFTAAELLAALREADGPVDVDGAFAAVRGRVPTWEHHKNPRTWADVWRDRAGDLLDWLVLLGLAERVDGGYRAAGGDPDGGGTDAATPEADPDGGDPDVDTPETDADDGDDIAGHDEPSGATDGGDR